MNLRKFGVVIGLATALLLTGCQTAEVEAPQSEQEIGAAEQEQEADHDDEDYSEGFKMSKQALDVYMTEIVHKDYRKAYEALHQVDKDTFTAEDFVAYQASMQLSKDVHGYSIHDEQTYWDFEFAGVKFEQVDFFDIDLAYVEMGAEPLDVDEDDDHNHDEGSDYHTHDHGHEMATMGVAAVRRNGDWFILQGLSAYEMKDLTRKYTNQSVSHNMEKKDEYILGEIVPIGNMMISVNDAIYDSATNTYKLDVAFMNVGFEPLNTDHFVSKFAVIDSNLMNYLSQPVDESGALNGVVRAGSYARGSIQIPVNEGFEADSVFFLMNTVDPEREPIKFDMTKRTEFDMVRVFENLQRKPNVKMDSKAYIDGAMLSITNVDFSEKSKALTAPDGWEVLSFDAEISNLTDEILYSNQLDLTVRMPDGTSLNVQDQLLTEKLDGVMTANEHIEVLVKQSQRPIEVTMSINDTRPNNSVTIEVE